MAVRLRGQFVVSLDFELHWGVRDHVALAGNRERLLGVRKAVPALLQLFAERGIHATWATVGLLFARSRDEALAGAPSERPAYRNAGFDPWPELLAAGTNEETDPFHFAASLVDEIARAPHQELATHTWSHFYCLEEGATLSAFLADIEAAKAIGRRHGDVTQAIVFPRNQFSPQVLAALKQLGTRVFRGNPEAWFWQPHASNDETIRRRLFRLVDAYVPASRQRLTRVTRHETGLIDVPATRFLRPWSRRLAPLDPLRLRRITEEMTAAAENGTLFHLWWHPHNFGVNLAENLSFLAHVLDHYATLRERNGFHSLSMSEAADYTVSESR